MPFPYEQYVTLAEPLTVYHPGDQESLAHWIMQSIDKASQLLKQLLGLPMPEIQVILVAPGDWSVTPHDDPEEPSNALPYWTNATRPPSIFIPSQLDSIIGTPTQEKLEYLSYVALTQDRYSSFSCVGVPIMESSCEGMKIEGGRVALKASISIICCTNTG